MTDSVIDTYRKSPVHDVLHLIGQILLLQDVCHFQLLLHSLQLILHTFAVARLGVSFSLQDTDLLGHILDGLTLIT